MKVCLFLLIAVALTSCNGVPGPSAKSAEPIKPWQKKIVRRQKHTYTQSGLLDTTYRVEDYYVNGQLGATMDFLIIRTYDNKDNLMRERTFQFIKKKRIFSEETLFEYDAKNNLILKTNIFQKVLGEMSKFKYNDFGQKVEEIKIQKLPDIMPENWNMDSLLAHHSDKIIHHYDTLTIAYGYNTNGDIVGEVYKKANKIDYKLITLFSKNLKALTFEINSKGDTISITRYERNKDLMIEIKNDKRANLYTDTTIFSKNLKLQSTVINSALSYRHKDAFKYDERGNEIEYISFE